MLLDLIQSQAAPPTGIGSAPAQPSPANASAFQQSFSDALTPLAADAVGAEPVAVQEAAMVENWLPNPLTSAANATVTETAQTSPLNLSSGELEAQVMTLSQTQLPSVVPTNGGDEQALTQAQAAIAQHTEAAESQSAAPSFTVINSTGQTVLIEQSPVEPEIDLSGFNDLDASLPSLPTGAFKSQVTAKIAVPTTRLEDSGATVPTEQSHALPTSFVIESATVVIESATVGSQDAETILSLPAAPKQMPVVDHASAADTKSAPLAPIIVRPTASNAVIPTSESPTAAPIPAASGSSDAATASAPVASDAVTKVTATRLTAVSQSSPEAIQHLIARSQSVDAQPSPPSQSAAAATQRARPVQQAEVLTTQPAQFGATPSRMPQAPTISAASKGNPVVASASVPSPGAFNAAASGQQPRPASHARTTGGTAIETVRVVTQSATQPVAPTASISSAALLTATSGSQVEVTTPSRLAPKLGSAASIATPAITAGESASRFDVSVAAKIEEASSPSLEVPQRPVLELPPRHADVDGLQPLPPHAHADEDAEAVAAPREIAAADEFEVDDIDAPLQSMPTSLFSKPQRAESRPVAFKSEPSELTPQPQQLSPIAASVAVPVESYRSRTESTAQPRWASQDEHDNIELPSSRLTEAATASFANGLGAIAAANLKATQPSTERPKVDSSLQESVETVVSEMQKNVAANSVDLTATSASHLATSSANSIGDDAGFATRLAEPSQPSARFAEPTLALRQVVGAMQQAVESGERLRVHLNPPELGTVMVEVARTATGIVAKIEFSNASTQQSVANSLPELHRSLSQTGIVLDRVEVTIRDQRSEPQDRQPREERGRQQNFQQQRQEQERQRQQQQRRFQDEDAERAAA